MNDCSKLIQFDTVSISNDLTEFLSITKFIKKENYEEAKAKASGKILEILDLDFEHYQNNLTKLTQKFNLTNFTESKYDYYHHVLSPSAAKIYADCIRQNSNNQLSAWVESINENKIIIGVKNGLTGNSRVKYRIVGAKPNNKPSVLNSQSEEHLMFDYNPSMNFSIVLTSKNLESEAIDSVSITIPKKRKFEIKTEAGRQLEGFIRAGAGCHNNRKGCAFCVELNFIADEGFELKPETLKQESVEVVGGPGLLSCDIQWHKIEVDGEVKKMIGYAHNITGNSPHTQGISKYKFSIRQSKEVLIEII